MRLLRQFKPSTTQTRKWLIGQSSRFSTRSRNKKVCIANLCRVGKSGQTSTATMTANIGRPRILSEQALCRDFASVTLRCPQDLASQKATAFIFKKSQLGTTTQSIVAGRIRALPLYYRSIPLDIP